MMPVWSKRNIWIKEFIPPHSSIIDWGCGNKDILNYVQPKEYLGIDKSIDADLVIDFDRQVPKIDKKYDIGLVLGILEYIDDYESFLNNIKHSADTFLILSLVDRKIKKEWKNSFTTDHFTATISRCWKNSVFERNQNYILAISRE